MANTPWRPTVVQSLLAAILLVQVAILVVLTRLDAPDSLNRRSRYIFIARDQLLIRCDPVTGEAWMTEQEHNPHVDPNIGQLWIPIGVDLDTVSKRSEKR